MNQSEDSPPLERPRAINVQNVEIHVTGQADPTRIAELVKRDIDQFVMDRGGGGFLYREDGGISFRSKSGTVTQLTAPELKVRGWFDTFRAWLWGAP